MYAGPPDHHYILIIVAGVMICIMIMKAETYTLVALDLNVISVGYNSCTYLLLISL